MRMILLAGLLMVALVPLVSQAASSVMTGQLYYVLPEIGRVAYAAGWIDGFLSGGLAGPAGRRMYDQCVQQWTIAQLTAVIDRYVKNHSDQAMSVVTLGAVVEACRR